MTAGQGARGRVLHLGDGCANSGQVGDNHHPILEEWESCLGGWLRGRQRAFQQSVSGEGGSGKGTQ